jgi:hypothetical protein
MARKSSLSYQSLPFYPDDASFNLANALYLAHASDIAYHRAPAAAASERLGLATIAFRNKITRTRGFLGVCDTHAILAFRGSDPLTLPNWLTDVVVKLVECREYEGRVHHGFSFVLKRTWGKIEPILEKAQGKPLFLTGHSMGGALSILTGCRLAKIGLPPMAIYTFGAPRVGDHSFCSGYSLPTYRVVNHLDLVPELPLASMKRLLLAKLKLKDEKAHARIQQMAERVPCYGHVKSLVYIDSDGAITTDADIEPWHTHAVARAIETRGRSFIEGVTDHMISNYIRGLAGQLTRRQSRVRRRNRLD